MSEAQKETEWVVPKPYGHCPSCGADMNGEPIWLYFVTRLMLDGYYQEAEPLPRPEAEAKADEIAENYGATRTSGRFSRVILFKNERIGDHRGRDIFLCPDCGFEW